MPKNSEVDVPLNYADFYFLEALLRYRARMNAVNASATIRPPLVGLIDCLFLNTTRRDPEIVLAHKPQC
jgi:hypothetical protein